MFRRWVWNALKWGSDTLRERIRHYWICLSFQNANVNFFRSGGQLEREGIKVTFEIVEDSESTATLDEILVTLESHVSQF